MLASPWNDSFFFFYQTLGAARVSTFVVAFWKRVVLRIQPRQRWWPLARCAPMIVCKCRLMMRAFCATRFLLECTISSSAWLGRFRCRCLLVRWTIRCDCWWGACFTYGSWDVLSAIPAHLSICKASALTLHCTLSLLEWKLYEIQWFWSRITLEKSVRINEFSVEQILKHVIPVNQVALLLAWRERRQEIYIERLRTFRTRTKLGGRYWKCMEKRKLELFSSAMNFFSYLQL